MTRVRGIEGTPDKDGLIWARGTVRGTDGRRVRVWGVKDAETGVATQGHTKRHARAMIAEATQLYREVTSQDQQN